MKKRRSDKSGQPEGVTKRRKTTPPSSGAEGLLRNIKCAVCWESPCNLVSTPCGHLFCGECALRALKASTSNHHGSGTRQGYVGTCPVCRQRVASKSLIAMELKVGPYIIEE